MIAWGIYTSCKWQQQAEGLSLTEPHSPLGFTVSMMEPQHHNTLKTRSCFFPLFTEGAPVPGLDWQSAECQSQCQPQHCTTTGSRLQCLGPTTSEPVHVRDHIKHYCVAAQNHSSFNTVHPKSVLSVPCNKALKLLKFTLKFISILTLIFVLQFPWLLQLLDMTSKYKQPQTEFYYIFLII